MAEYVYPALFHPNSDGTYTVTYPDLPGCITEGKSLENAMYMAQTALSQWVEFAAEQKESLPAPSAVKALPSAEEEFITLIRAEIKSDRAVKRTVSLPKWMDDKVAEVGLSLSRVLQDALKERFSV